MFRTSFDMIWASAFSFDIGVGAVGASDSLVSRARFAGLSKGDVHQGAC